MMRSSMKRTLALLLTIVMVMGLVVVPAGAARPMGGEVAETPSAGASAAPTAGGKSAGTVGYEPKAELSTAYTLDKCFAASTISAYSDDYLKITLKSGSESKDLKSGEKCGSDESAISGKVPTFGSNADITFVAPADGTLKLWLRNNSSAGTNKVYPLASIKVKLTTTPDSGSAASTNPETTSAGLLEIEATSGTTYKVEKSGNEFQLYHATWVAAPVLTDAEAVAAERIALGTKLAALTSVKQANVGTKAQAIAAVEAVVGTPGHGVAAAVSIEDSDFTAATTGTEGTPTGTDGSFTYKVTLTKGEETDDSTTGTVTITATPYRVKADAVEMSDATASLKKDGTKTLTATMKKNDVADPTISDTIVWDSDTKTVATVSDSGEVTAKAIGQAVISATAIADADDGPQDGDAEGTCVVSVTGADQTGPYELDVNLMGQINSGDSHKFVLPQGKTCTEVVYNNYFSIFFPENGLVDNSSKKFDNDYTAAQRINFRGNGAGVDSNCIKFTVSEGKQATVQVWWRAGADGRQMALLDSEGTQVAATSVVASGKAKSTSGDPYISTLTAPSAGVYYLGGLATAAGDNGVIGGNYICKVKVTEEVAADTNVTGNVVLANLGKPGDNNNAGFPASGWAENYTITDVNKNENDKTTSFKIHVDSLTKHVPNDGTETAIWRVGFGAENTAKTEYKWYFGTSADSSDDATSSATNKANAGNAHANIGTRYQTGDETFYNTAYLTMTETADGGDTTTPKTYYATLIQKDSEGTTLWTYKATFTVGELIDPDHTYALTVGAETLTMKMGVAEYESISFTSTDTANGGSAEAVNPTVVSADSTKVTATLNNADDNNNSILIRARAATTTPVNVTVTNGNKVKTIAVTVVASDATEGYTMPTQWNFKGDEIGMVYQATGKFRGLDISSGTHIRPGDNGLQFYDAGGTVSIPVTGASKITVTGAHASGKLWMADSDVPEATPVDGKVGDLVFIYTGTGPAVLTTGAGGACIAAIKVEEYQAPATPVITAKVTDEEDGTLTKTLTAVKSGAAFAQMSVTATVSDNSTPTYKWTKGTETTPLGTEATYTPAGTAVMADNNSVYKCTVSATGAEDVVITFTVKVEKADGPAAPVVTSFVATGCKADGTKGTITGPTAAMEYKKDDGDWTAVTLTEGKMTNLEAGSYTFRVAATDEANESAASDAVVVTKAMAFTAPNVTATYDGTANKIAVTVTKPASGAVVKYSATAGDYTTTEIEVTDANVDSPKTVYFEITAEGYTTETGSATITVNKAAAPTITVRANPKKVAVTGGTVTFTATVTGLVAADEANPTAISANCSQGKTFSITKGATGWSGTNTIEASDGTEKTHTVSFTWTNANYTAPSIADVVITQLAEDAVVPVVAEDLQIWTQTLSTGGTAPDYAALGIAAKAENNIVTINIDEAKILTAFADEAKKAIFQAVPKMNHNGTAYLMFQFKAPTGVADGWKIQQVITKDGGTPDEGNKWTVSEASDAAGDLNYNLLQGGTARYVGDWFGVLTGVTGSEQGMPTTGTYEVAYNFFDGDTVKNIVELTVVREVTAAKALSITANNATATVTNTGVYNKTAAAAGMKVSPAEDVVIELTAADNYDLPETASVQIGSADASDVAIADGKITIAKASITGDITVTVTAVQQKVATPTAEIDYANEKITGLTSAGGYTINGSDATVTDNKADIASGMFGTTVAIVAKATGGKAASEAQNLDIPARPDTPTGTGVAPTAEGGTDGKITGLTANAIYSVKKGADAATDKTADADGVITGLAAGSYTVTLKATESAFASAASADITVADGPSAPTNFTVTYVAVADEGTVSITDKVSGLATTVADGGKVTLPAADDMAVDGYTFVKWTKDSGTDAVTGEQTITADTTFKANYTKNVATPDPEYSDLAAAIEAAEQALKDANIQEDDVERSSIKKGTEFVHKTDADAYQAAIDVAKQVDENADTDAIIAALDALKTATEAFENATLTGTKSSSIGVIGGGGGGATTPATTTKTETLTDGTKRVTETAKDGTVTVTDTKPDGTKLVSTTTPDGDTTTKVTLPKGTESATVSVPVEKDDSGLVAIKVNPDGTEEVIRDSVVVDGEMVFEAEDGETVKIANKAKHFVDIDGHWAEKNVDFVTARDLFNGVDATHFSPDTAMTRGMMATVLFRLDGELKADKAADFADVKDGDWYDSAVDWAADAGVINGYTDGTFAPNRAITREELVLMVYRYAGTPAVDGTKGMTAFTDVDTISTWAADAMRWAVQNGIINGKGNGTIDPKANATRAEVSAVLERYVKLAAK